MKEAVLITYMGARSSLEEIRPFLYRLFSDRDLINFGVPSFFQKPLAFLISLFRTPKVSPQYRAIGGGSPLVAYSLEQAGLLEKRLGLKVFVGMLYSEPLLSRTVKELKAYNPDVVYHLTLYPHYSRATVGACVRDVERHIEQEFRIFHVKSWADNSRYVEWIRKSLKSELNGANPEETVVLFSAHSLPKYFIEKFQDPYVNEVKRTVRLVMESFPRFRSRISYQSKVGPIEWLRPSTEEELKKIAEEGFKRVVV
ncbi:MAG: ferrochelatase, partial [Desulfurobacteriaceae bacterium]